MLLSREFEYEVPEKHKDKENIFFKASKSRQLDPMKLSVAWKLVPEASYFS